MATKKNCACLDNSADDEPIFVLCARDLSAPAVIEHWVSINPQLPKEKADEALVVANAMRAWPRRKRAD